MKKKIKERGRNSSPLSPTGANIENKEVTIHGNENREGHGIGTICCVTC